MGSIGDLAGGIVNTVGNLAGIHSGNGGNAGQNFSASGAPIINPITDEQQFQANRDAIQTAAQQQAFATAVAGQNGLNNSVNALNQQASLNSGLAGQNGVGNQSSVFAQQQGLAGQYQDLANGTGANPALAQLQQTTGQNIAAQAALAASQRGASANAGLIARQAAMQGAGIQQQAVGQAATLGAQQQLAGLQGLQNQQQLLGTTAAQQVAQQQAGITNLANQATNQVNQQQNAINAAQQGAQGVQGNVNNAIANVNSANVGSTGNQNSANAGIANTVAQGQQAFTAGILNGVGGGLGLGGGGAQTQAATKGAGAVGPAAAGAKGGLAEDIPKVRMAEGGDPMDAPPAPIAVQQIAPAVTVTQAASPYASNAARNLFNDPSASGLIPNSPQQPQSSSQELQKSTTQFSGAIAKGLNKDIGGLFASSPTPAPGLGAAPSQGLAPMEQMEAKGGRINAKAGGKIPGKPKVGGAKDSYANDTVPALLSAGEIVIPRHITQAPNAPQRAAEFVAAVMAKKRHA